MLCPNWIALSLVPVSEHALSDQPQLAIAHMTGPVAVTTNQFWGVLNIDIVVSSLNTFPDMVMLRLVGPHHNRLSGVYKRLNRLTLVILVHWSYILHFHIGLNETNILRDVLGFENFL